MHLDKKQRLVKAGIKVVDNKIKRSDVQKAISILTTASGLAGDTSEPGNYFFILKEPWSDDFYDFKPDIWYCAAGDFMEKPHKLDIIEYFGGPDKVEVEWRNAGNFKYDCPDAGGDVKKKVADFAIGDDMLKPEYSKGQWRPKFLASYEVFVGHGGSPHASLSDAIGKSNKLCLWTDDQYRLLNESLKEWMEEEYEEGNDYYTPLYVKYQK